MKRLSLLIALAFGALLALAGPASAHVTVSAPGATPGGTDQEITFRVPVEKDVATVGLTVALPLDTPLLGVLVDPIPGWTHVEKTQQLAKPVKTYDGRITSAISQITWTATAGNGVKPGEFGSFTIIAGQLPKTSSVTFKAIQKYADGSKVSWIEVAAPGSTVEPEDPAPVLSLKPGAAVASSADPVTKVEKASTTAPTVLAIAALVVAAGALAYAFVTRAKARA